MISMYVWRMSQQTPFVVLARRMNTNRTGVRKSKSSKSSAKYVPHGSQETVVIESSFIMSPMRVVIPTANDACTRMRSGIRIPDFPSRNKRYITHVNEPTDQSKRSAGYAGESMSSFSVVYWSSPTSATNQTSEPQGCEAFHP